MATTNFFEVLAFMMISIALTVFAELKESASYTTILQHIDMKFLFERIKGE